MSNFKRFQKVYLVILLAILLLATILLAVSIQNIEFKPARYAPPAYSLFETEAQLPEVHPLSSDGAAGSSPIAAANITLMLSVVLSLIIFISLVSKDGRRSLFNAVLRAAAFGIMFYYIAPSFTSAFSGFLAGATVSEQAGTGQASLPSMPTIFSFVVSLPLALLLTFLAWRLYKRFRSKPAPLQADFAAEAQSSLAALDAGGDLRDTIINCYRGMLTQARRANLIGDEKTATTIDLEHKLIAYGLPQRETQRLTRLFEAVRYGSHQTSERERLEARDCLSTFVASCDQQFGRKQAVTT